MSSSDLASAPPSPPARQEHQADEAKLIERARSQELDAFNQLVLRYQNLAYSVAYRMIQDDAATLDIVQDSFIKAYHAMPRFAGGNFKSWLMRIVVNSCYDELRKRKRRRTDSLENLTTEPEPLATLTSRPEAPEDHAERMELQRAIEAGITRLPDEQRMALVLCDIHGHSYEEIVDITGWPMGTVKSRINRGRIKLREMLLENPELLPPAFRPKNG